MRSLKTYLYYVYIYISHEEDSCQPASQDEWSGGLHSIPPSPSSRYSTLSAISLQFPSRKCVWHTASSGTSVCPIAAEVHFAHSVSRCYMPASPPAKLLLFAFSISKYFVVRGFETMLNHWTFFSVCFHQSGLLYRCECVVSYFIKQVVIHYYLFWCPTCPWLGKQQPTHSTWLARLSDTCLSFFELFLTLWYKKVFWNHLVFPLPQPWKWVFFVCLFSSLR